MKPNPDVRLIAENLFKPHVPTGKQEVIIQLGKQWFTRKRFKEGKLKTMPYLRAFDIGKFRYVEQNPESMSYYANRVKNGELIVWVFNEGGYLALIIKTKNDWEVHQSKPGVGNRNFWDRVGTV
jgi:hypothetical protein